MVFGSVLFPFFLHKLGELPFLLEPFVPTDRTAMGSISNKNTILLWKDSKLPARRQMFDVNMSTFGVTLHNRGR